MARNRTNKRTTRVQWFKSGVSPAMLEMRARRFKELRDAEERDANETAAEAARTEALLAKQRPWMRRLAPHLGNLSEAQRQLKGIHNLAGGHIDEKRRHLQNKEAKALRAINEVMSEWSGRPAKPGKQLEDLDNRDFEVDMDTVDASSDDNDNEYWYPPIGA